MQPDLITIWINGDPRIVPSNQSLSALLHHLELPSDRIAVEMNKSIVRARDWETTAVPDGSRVEIVEFVGGG